MYSSSIRSASLLSLPYHPPLLSRPRTPARCHLMALPWKLCPSPPFVALLPVAVSSHPQDAVRGHTVRRTCCGIRRRIFIVPLATLCRSPSRGSDYLRALKNSSSSRGSDYFRVIRSSFPSRGSNLSSCTMPDHLFGRDHQVKHTDFLTHL
ncbi:hypothetical protein EDB89DRAFT_1977960 [Lactarius sanguifluus]|nr:hypothetical protein EDB89DRAFT_1977960 [Lactarius sanguifluus]